MAINLEKVGDNIKERRKALKLTQRELADRLKVKNGVISKWEKGKTKNLSILTLSLIADVLQAELGELLM